MRRRQADNTNPQAQIAPQMFAKQISGNWAQMAQLQPRTPRIKPKPALAALGKKCDMAIGGQFQIGGIAQTKTRLRDV